MDKSNMGSFFAVVYRLHALSGDLVRAIESPVPVAGHALTAAVANLIDAWIAAVQSVEIAEFSMGPDIDVHAREVRSIRAVMYSAHLRLIEVLSRAVQARAVDGRALGGLQRRRDGVQQRAIKLKQRLERHKTMLAVFIEKNPGLNMSGISKGVALCRTTIRAPLVALQQEGRIRVEVRGKSGARYFACSVPLLTSDASVECRV